MSGPERVDLYDVNGAKVGEAWRAPGQAGEGWTARVGDRVGTADTLAQFAEHGLFAIAPAEAPPPPPPTPARAKNEALSREEHRRLWRETFGSVAGERQPHRKLDEALTLLAAAEGREYVPPPEPPAPRPPPAPPPEPSAEEKAAIERKHREGMRELLGAVAGGTTHRFFDRRDPARATADAVRAALTKEK